MFVAARSIVLLHVVCLFFFFSYSCFTTFSSLFSDITSIAHVFVNCVCVHFLFFLFWCMRAWSSLIRDYHLEIRFWPCFFPLSCHTECLFLFTECTSILCGMCHVWGYLESRQWPWFIPKIKRRTQGNVSTLDHGNDRVSTLPGNRESVQKFCSQER